MTPWVSEATLPQPIGLVDNRGHEDSTVLDGSFDDRVRVLDEQVEPHRCPAEGLRTQVGRLRRLFRDPEPSLADRQFGNDPPIRVGVPVDLLGAECLRVERDGFVSSSHGENSSDQVFEHESTDSFAEFLPQRGTFQRGVKPRRPRPADGTLLTVTTPAHYGAPAHADPSGLWFGVDSPAWLFQRLAQSKHSVVQPRGNAGSLAYPYAHGLLCRQRGFDRFNSNALDPTHDVIALSAPVTTTWSPPGAVASKSRSLHQLFGHHGHLAAVVGNHIQDAPADWDIEAIGGTCSGKEIDLSVPESRRHRLTGTDNGRP